MEVYNFSAPLALLLAVGGVVTCGNCWKIDLHDLARHNRIEHDASLAHGDAPPGCPYAPTTADGARTQELLDITSASYLTFEDFAHARAVRDRQCIKSLDWLHTKIAYGEAVLTLKVFGQDNHSAEDSDAPKTESPRNSDSAQFRVPKPWLSQWFGEDRLPEGWTKPLKRIRLRSVASVSRKIAQEVRSLEEKDP